MTLVEDVRRAKTPREAILLLAAAVDQLRAAHEAVDPWESWGNEPYERGAMGAGPAALERAPVQGSDGDRDPESAPRLNLTEDDVRTWIESNYGRAIGDDAEARVVIAQVKRDLERSTDAKVAEDLFIQTNGVIESVIDFSPQDDAHRALREQFARDVLQLDVALGPHPEGGDWASDYASAGPMWLYIPNRDLLMQYPDAVKAAMVADVQRYDEKVAYEMGADVLKQPMQKDDQSPAMRLANG